MNSQQKNRISIALMSSSLILLGIFLFFWLTSLYQQEAENQKDRNTFAFINAIRDAETKFIRNQLDSIMELNKNKGGARMMAKMSVQITNDETLAPPQIRNIIKNIKADPDTSVKIWVHMDDQLKLEGNHGAIVQYLSEQLPPIYKELNPILQKDSIILKEMEAIIAQSSFSKRLPGDYQVIKLTDSLKNSTIIHSEVYRDISSGESFALQIQEFDQYVFQKITPQIIFAALLFTLTTLTFLFVYKNLLKEQQLTVLKNDLISNITHELKTPISTVGVAIEALQNFGALEDPNKTKEYLNIAQQEINRLSILVEKVLNTSLFERPDFPIKKEEINMQELILSVLNSMKLQFQNKKALVDFTSHGDNFQISGDRTHVTSVIYNLVENALKYSPINPKIKINLQTKEQELHLSIIDNGLGIPKEFHDKIFEKFFRTPTGNTHNIKGQGLGLSYVKKVIEKHSGNIRVESNINKGSHFLISFPI